MAMQLIERRLRDQPWSRQAGSLTDIYELDEKHGSAFLGKGTFGTVMRYRAPNGDLAAVKGIRKNSVIGNLAKARQLSIELAAIPSLSHANLVRTREVIETRDYFHLVMDVCPGVTIKDYMAQTASTLPPHQAGVVLYQVLDAIRYLHANHIVHRDVKPANVMIDSQNGFRTVLIDVGLAKCVEPATTSTKSGAGNATFSLDPGFSADPVGAGEANPRQEKTSSDSFERASSCSTDASMDDETVLATPDAGSTFYLAFEGIKGKLDSDEQDDDHWCTTRERFFKLDIYAAGITAFYMLTGTLPYSICRGSLSRLKSLMQLNAISFPPGRFDAAVTSSLLPLLGHNVDTRPTAEAALLLPWIASFAGEVRALLAKR